MFAMYLSHLPSPYFQKVYSKKNAVQFLLLGMFLFFFFGNPYSKQESPLWTFRPEDYYSIIKGSLLPSLLQCFLISFKIMSFYL